MADEQRPQTNRTTLFLFPPKKGRKHNLLHVEGRLWFIAANEIAHGLRWKQMQWTWTGTYMAVLYSSVCNGVHDECSHLHQGRIHHSELYTTWGSRLSVIVCLYRSICLQVERTRQPQSHRKSLSTLFPWLAESITVSSAVICNIGLRLPLMLQKLPKERLGIFRESRVKYSTFLPAIFTYDCFQEITGPASY